MSTKKNGGDRFRFTIDVLGLTETGRGKIGIDDN